MPRTSNLKRTQKSATPSLEIVGSPVKSQVYAQTELITPAIAKRYLATMGINRKLNKERVRLYAADMAEGRWKDTGETIQFNTLGKLLDGQTRLNAVIQAGVPITFLVAYNCPEDAQQVTDSGQSRTTTQSLQIAGVEISTLEVSVFRSMFSSLEKFEPRNLSRPMLIDLLPEYREAVQFAATQHGAHSIKSASIRSLVARAFYCGEDKDRLSRFLFMLDKGLAEGAEDHPAIALRNLHLNLRKGYRDRVEVYAKAIYALDHFLKRQPTRNLRFAREDMWVIPALQIKD